jgi:hypothetical protein
MPLGRTHVGGHATVVVVIVVGGRPPVGIGWPKGPTEVTAVPRGAADCGPGLRRRPANEHPTRHEERTMSHQTNSRTTTDRNRGTESSGARSSATTAIVIGVIGVIAGVMALNDLYPVLMGIVALVAGAIALIMAGGAWKRSKDTTGEAAGTPGTNLSIAGVVAGVAAAVLGVMGITAETTDVDEGVDQVEQDAEELTDDVTG